MNLKTRGTSKNAKLRALKSKTVGLCKRVVQELKDLIYKQSEKHKSYNIRRKFSRLGLKTIGKRQNLSNKDVNKVKQLNELTTHGLKTIAKLRESKSYSNMTREQLIYTLLRSEKASQEDNYLTHLESTATSDLKKRIKHVRVLSTKLSNILTNKERKTIRDELRRLETTRLTRTQIERATTYLIDLKREPENKQKYHNSDYHNKNYYGIKDIEHLFNETIDDYYKPILVRFAFENNFEEYEIRGDKDKNLSLKEYIATITPQLVDLINKKRIVHKKNKRFN